MGSALLTDESNRLWIWSETRHESPLVDGDRKKTRFIFAHSYNDTTFCRSDCSATIACCQSSVFRLYFLAEMHRFWSLALLLLVFSFSFEDVCVLKPINRHMCRLKRKTRLPLTSVN